MAISCSYCGGQHASVADVRACWQRSQQADPAPGAVFPVAPVAPPAAPARAGAEQASAGPEQLGRHVVVGPGQSPPGAWDRAPRLTLDAAAFGDPVHLVTRLRQHAHGRERAVIELSVPFGEPPRTVETRAPHELGPRFQLHLDELHHLVWSNSVDARQGSLRWALLDRAVALGARAGGPADVVLPSGEPAWLDGGPVRHTSPVQGVPVLHALAVEHGSLVPYGSNTCAADLAPDQLAAVTHHGGAARIIAPAGSGKTRVLTERARHLVQQWHLPPSAVSLVAFNRRAQQEMAARTSDVPALQVRTLNAIALAVINGTPPFSRQPRTWRTIDEGEVRRILGRLVETPARRNQDPLAPWIEALGVVRLGLEAPEVVEARYDGDIAGFAQVWPRYVASLDRDGAVDFDHQIHRALELLLTDADARTVAQRACRVLLVDEFQDLTPAHLLLVRVLSAPGSAVFAVGDDDQTIYGYNGADPAWLIDFAELFPGAGDHPLEVNYRCPGGVVVAADRLLRRNGRRVAKVVRSSRPHLDGLQVSHHADTVATTCATVTEAIASGRSPADIAVLTRVNALLVPVQAALGEAGVPLQGGGGADFAGRTAVRAVLAWMRLAQSGDRLVAADLAEAMRRPSRPLHPQVSEWVREQSSVPSLRRLAGRLNSERDAERVVAFADDIHRLARLADSGGSTAALVATVVDDIGLGGAVATLDHTRRGMNRTAQGDDLMALRQLAALHPTPGTFESWLHRVLSRPDRAGGVTLATVHRVKGQEWPLVVIHEATEEQYPHRLAEDVEEERRIFHVAVTRASDAAVVVAGARPSPFVAQLTTEPSATDVPVGTATDPRRSAVSAPPSRPARGRSESEPRRGPLAEGGRVLAAPGLVLVDAGQEWVVLEVHDAGVLAGHGPARRRFSFGSKVVTMGRQRGALAVPEGPDAPSPSSIRAYDLLRQRREVLRDGKPAYVVFDDATLERLALALPISLDAVAEVHGVGPRKLELYGDEVLLAVEDAQSGQEPRAL